MKSFSSQLQKEAAKIRMRASVRRELRERIVSYMEYHPITDTMPTQRTEKASDRLYTTERFTRISFNISSLYVRAFAGVFVVALVVGVPYAAEQAVPGDVLYPVKVRVNEELLGQLALTPYEKIEWETRRVERRIAEARLLAKEGRLTEEVEAEISETVRAHASEAQKGLALLHETDADGAAVARVALESALDVQSAVLETDSDAAATSTGAGSTIRDLSVVVKNAKEEVAAEGATLTGSTTPSYDRFIARLEQETTRAHELFRSVSGSLSPDDQAEIERRLADIGRQAAEAATLKDAEPGPGKAVALLRSALSNTQKLVAFMTYIDVRNSVKVESLVPKTLTDEERLLQLESVLAEIRALRGDALARAGSVDDTNLSEKVAVGIAEVDRLLDEAVRAIETDSIADAEAKATEALAFARDLVALVGNLPISGEIISPDTPDTATSTEDTSEVQ